MSTKRKAMLFGASLTISCTMVTLLSLSAPSSSAPLTIRVFAIVAVIWVTIGAACAAAYYQEQTKRTRE